jgi:hypothetical protein
MAVPVWAVGQVLSASDVNTWFVPITVVKPSDTGRNTTTTMTADPDLTLAVATNSTYEVRALIQYKGGTNNSSDAQFTITAPASSTGFFIGVRRQITGPLTSGIDWTALGGAMNAGTNGTGTVLPLILTATVTTAGTAGNIAVAWAQNTSNGTNTTVMAGSQLILQRTG